MTTLTPVPRLRRSRRALFIGLWLPLWIASVLCIFLGAGQTQALGTAGARVLVAFLLLGLAATTASFLRRKKSLPAIGEQLGYEAKPFSVRELTALRNEHTRLRAGSDRVDPAVVLRGVCAGKEFALFDQQHRRGASVIALACLLWPFALLVLNRTTFVALPAPRGMARGTRRVGEFTLSVGERTMLVFVEGRLIAPEQVGELVRRTGMVARMVTQNPRVAA